MADVKISNLPVLTTPALLDLLATVDVGVGTTKKITAQDFMKILNFLTAYVTPLAADVLAIYDNANTETKKITPIDLMKAVDLLTAYITPLAADTLPIWDDVNSVTKKMTTINLMKVINVLAAWTTPAAADTLLIYDSANAIAKKITPANFLKIINLLNALATADADDRLAIYDDDAVEVKKIPFSHTAINGTAPATKGGTGQTTYNKGDLLHASVANVLTALAIGTADYKLFTNAAGDLPEWAVGIKIGTFLRLMNAASGNVAYAGIGFKPSLVIFSGGVSGGFIATYFGMDDGTLHYSVGNWGASAPGFCNVDQNNCIILLEDAAGTKIQRAALASLDADGFTLTWTRVGVTAAGNANIHYIAFR